MRPARRFSIKHFLVVSAFCAAALPLVNSEAVGQSIPPITISSSVPNELNPSNGGAPMATPEQASAFAWQEFIALNWPAGPQEGKPGQRDTPSSHVGLVTPRRLGLLVWQTLRHKVEIFPGNYKAYLGSYPPQAIPVPTGDASLGYDALPVYSYSTAYCGLRPSKKTIRHRGSISTRPTRLRSTVCLPALWTQDSSTGNSFAATDPLPRQGKQVAICVRRRAIVRRQIRMKQWWWCYP